SLFHPTILESNRSLRHQLDETETNPTLELVFNRQRVNGETTINRNSRPMNLRTFVFDRDVNRTGNGGPKTLMTGNARRMSLRQALSPRALLLQQIEHGPQFLRFRFQELATVSNRIHFGTHS